MRARSQRIRDPLHNLIEFGTDQFHQTLWRVIQTAPFQRLRRIRQLGFSELVYPGASHTRFAHSIGAFHTATRLTQIINRHIGHTQGNRREHQEEVALAAALLHDVGHGMFSHAFEDVGRRLNLEMVRHELISDHLIRHSEIADELKKDLGSGFANDVADVIGGGQPVNLYDAVVSSQFDADRLDYMQRDRLMTGVRNSGIDFVWLLTNLEVGTVAVTADNEQVGNISTFVLGPKAIHAAEAYVVALFQLYPTVYFHKATRGAEKLFSEMMVRLCSLVKDGSTRKTGLDRQHPLIRFALQPDSIDRVLALDDAVFWGALPMMLQAQDHLIATYARRLWNRQLLKCVDIRQVIGEQLGIKPDTTGHNHGEVERIAVLVQEVFVEWMQENECDVPTILIDQADRDPYKRFQESTGPLNQINIRQGKQIVDIAEASPLIHGLRPFKLFRVYYDPADAAAEQFIQQTITQKIKERS